MTMRALRILLGTFALAMVALIIWIDVTTDMWQKYVVISGLAGGLVTFVLTALVVDRFVARAAHEQWEPVTRIALGDLRRQLAGGPERTARRLPEDLRTEGGLEQLIDAADAERDRVSEALARWASFLAASADVTDVLDAAAEIALHLDAIDEHARALRAGDTTGLPESDRNRLLTAVGEARDRHAEAADHLVARIDEVLARQSRGEVKRIAELLS